MTKSPARVAGLPPRIAASKACWSRRLMPRLGPVTLKCDPRQCGEVVAILAGERPVRVKWSNGWRGDYKPHELEQG
jgi:hypothetical protein